VELSIIIPLYNARTYIKECINSILCLKNVEFELIIIDDGSTDDSPEIVKAYEVKNIRYIHQQNSGPACARNRGLQEAIGDYVIFFDADDFIDSQAFYRFFQQAKKLDIDIAIGDGVYIYESGQKRFARNGLPSDIVTDGFSIMGLMQKHRCFRTEVWNHLFRREFLLGYGLRLDTTKYFGNEDVDFIPRCYIKAKKTVYINEAFYMYRQLGSSLSKIVAIEKINDYHSIITSFQSLSLRYDGVQKDILKRMIYDLYFDMFKSCKSVQCSSFVDGFKRFHTDSSYVLTSYKDIIKSFAYIFLPNLIKILER